MKSLSISSPVGSLTILEEDDEVTSVKWSGHRHDGHDDSPLLIETAAQLQAYFAGDLRAFDVPLRLGQSEFQNRFLSALIAIPFGETRTYGDIAKDLGASAQAIGQACGANPIPIIIPCHRVLAANGLGGFSGGMGIESKVALLRHEGAASLLI